VLFPRDETKVGLIEMSGRLRNRLRVLQFNGMKGAGSVKAWPRMYIRSGQKRGDPRDEVWASVRADRCKVQG